MRAVPFENQPDPSCMTELWPFEIGKSFIIDFVNTIKFIYSSHVLYIGNIDTFENYGRQGAGLIWLK